jgi:hypothetical protein
MISTPSTVNAAASNRSRRSRGQRSAPAFTVEIPELDDDAIERLAEVLVSMLDTFEQDEKTPGGEVPPGRIGEGQEAMK